jgi:hypothetical protein
LLDPIDSPQVKLSVRSSRWLNRFGKRTTGEAATVLVAGTIGSSLGRTAELLGNVSVLSCEMTWENSQLLKAAKPQSHRRSPFISRLSEMNSHPNLLKRGGQSAGSEGY